MKKSRFTDSQIIAILKQGEAGTPVPELCRAHGISSATYYKWGSKYGGMDASMMSRVKELEQENARLKKMYAEAQKRGKTEEIAWGHDALSLCQTTGSEIRYINPGL